jgi:hypothetical protein
MMTGLEPRDFTWVIARRLAVSERIGGYGFQHRRVRREEEISWLKLRGVTAVVSLLEGNQNLSSYEEAGLGVRHAPLTDLDPSTIRRIFSTLDDVLADPHQVVLLHRDTIDDAVAGVLAGYLIHSQMIKDPIVATAAIQEILKRPLGPEARAVIPEEAGT